MHVNGDRPRLVYVVTSALMVGKLPGQLRYLHERGFDVTIISPGGEGLDRMAAVDGVRTVEVPMAREISPLADAVSLWRLWRTLRALRPAITNVGTPKAGLLGGLAAWLNGVPCRVYTLRGLRFETTKGLKRRLLIGAERLSCALAHRVVCVSCSLCETAIETGLTRREKTVVFASGSSNGVDVERFAPTPETLRDAAALRRAIGIPAVAPVVGYVGRFTRDKGIPELVDAFLALGERFPDLRLLLVGRFEEEDPLPVATRRILETNPRVILAGHREQAHTGRAADRRRQDWPVGDVGPYYGVMDVFVLPSHREGFPNVVLEAHAAGKPVVAARATGVVDAIIDGETGLLFPVGDVVALTSCVARLLQDREMAHRLGRAGQIRAESEFRQERIWEALWQQYVALLQTRNARALRRGSRVHRAAKRVLDVAASATALTLLAPFLALVAAAIRVAIGRPILFRQTRPGYRARPFTLFKFRTLLETFDSEGNPLPDADRLTPLGKFLRRWSIDELPQLWNVLRGDMSLVGPRPLLMEYLGKYTPEQMRRHAVRPGLTGWAQLHGRQDLLFSRRLEMDCWYVDHWNVWLDLKLVWLTLLRLHKLSAVGATAGLEHTDDLGFAEVTRKRRKSATAVSIS
jgi:lipopolysaccharide/colanic/teichoic acid biosynthesis glycosyltransferase